ncbi:MAG: mycothiol synthase, partial [Nocardioidaceae bacterium]|nr:mycothiol synthase [Nocardioidaceae bacterium]
MDVTWRALMTDDIPAWVTLLAAAEAVDHTGEHFDDDDLLEELNDPATASRDRIGAWSGNELVAYAAVRPRANPTDYLRIHAEGTTHPQWRGRGLGGQLVSWVRGRVAEILDERGLTIDGHAEIVAFLANQGQIDL